MRLPLIVLLLSVLTNSAYSEELLKVLDNDNTQINLSSSKDKSDVTLSLYTDSNPINRFKLDFIGAIGDDENTKNFASFDGLGKGVKVKASYIRFFPSPVQLASSSWHITLQSLNIRMEEANNLYTQYKNKLAEQLPVVGCSTDIHCQSLKKAFDDALANFNSWSQSVNPPSNQAVTKWWTPQQTIISMGANRNDFKVLDLAEFSTDTKEKSGIEIGAALQWLVRPFTRVRVGYDFQRKYEQGGSSRQYCRDIDEFEGTTECISGNIQDISKGYNRNLYIKVGGYVNSPKKILKGWDVNVTHNFSDSKTGIELPLYFYSNKGNEVNAGLKFGFLINGDDDDDSAVVSIFFSSALNIFN